MIEPVSTETTPAGRYQRLEEIGRGGMGIVYRALDTLLAREVALKVLAPHIGHNETAVQRFQREMLVIARLEHAHIAPLYDAGMLDGQLFLAMRLLRGGTLRDRLANGKVETAALWQIARQVALALDAAHAQQVVHRDVKPANILFDEQGTAFLSDFGVAKVVNAATQLTGTSLVGTPAYMSPEQFTGQTVDGASDQYSLAAALFEALTGQPPFSGETLQIMYQHVHTPPPAAHVLRADLDPALSAALARALAKDPAERYPSVSAFVNELATAGTAAAALPVGAPVDPDTPVELSAGGAPPVNGLQTDLAALYARGLAAFERQEWAPAVQAFERIVRIDRAYRDASSLRREAKRRLQAAQSPTPPAPATTPVVQVVAGAGGTAVAPPKRAPFWLGGIVALFLLAAVAGLVVWPRVRANAAPALTPAVNTAADILTPATRAAGPAEAQTAVALLSGALQGAIWQVGADVHRVAADGRTPLPLDGTPLLVQAADGALELALPDGARLALQANGVVEITVVEPSEPPALHLVLRQGQLVAETSGPPLSVHTPFGAVAQTRGVMGLTQRASPFGFDVDCLVGSCQVTGDLSDTAVALQAGERSRVGGSGVPTAPEPARYDWFAGLAAAIPTATIAPTPTGTSTPEPTPAATAEPEETATATATGAAPSATPTRGPVTSGGGLPLNFVNFGVWTRGDEPNGAFTSSGEQNRSGGRSARLAYDFPTSGNDYVVFSQFNAISGTPNALQVWVYGDGSGHFLNAWIQDSEGQTWQAPFGRVTHSGWKQMTALIDTSQGWPWTHISGPNNQRVDYPIRFRAFVLDDLTDSYVGQGVIYLDELTAVTLSGTAVPATGGDAAAATPTPGGATPTPPPPEATGPVGRILYTSGNTLLTTDPAWPAPVELGTAAQDTCSNRAALVNGQTFNLYKGHFCGIGEGTGICRSPNGLYEVIVNGYFTQGFSISVRQTGAGDVATFIYNGALDTAEGIRWSPLSSSFLFVINDTVNQAFPGGGYNQIIQTAYTPIFSPDGALILYRKPVGPGVNDVFVANADGSEPRNVTNVTAADKRCAAWVMR